MNYKLINRLDPLIYLGLVLVGFILPEVVYRLFLFDFTAEFATNQEAMIHSEVPKASWTCPAKRKNRMAQEKRNSQLDTSELKTCNDLIA